MIVRSATLADAAKLAELGATTFVETFGNIYSAQDLAAFLSKNHSEVAHAHMLQDPEVGVWIATDDGGYALGYASAGPCKLPVENLEPGAGELRQIYVRSDHHGQGLGKLLLDLALEWLSNRHGPLYIGVWSENLSAQRLYQRRGFVKVSEYGFPVGNHIDHEFILKRNV